MQNNPMPQPPGTPVGKLTRVSVTIGFERPAEGKHSHGVFHNSTRRGYVYEISRGHIKPVVTTRGSGQYVVAQILCSPNKQIQPTSSSRQR